MHKSEVLMNFMMYILQVRKLDTEVTGTFWRKSWGVEQFSLQLENMRRFVCVFRSTGVINFSILLFLAIFRQKNLTSFKLPKTGCFMVKPMGFQPSTDFFPRPRPPLLQVFLLAPLTVSAASGGMMRRQKASDRCHRVAMQIRHWPWLLSGWWFLQDFLFSPRKLGKMNPIWLFLIFFKGVETTNKLYIMGSLSKSLVSKLGSFHVICNLLSRKNCVLPILLCFFGKIWKVCWKTATFMEMTSL